MNVQPLNEQDIPAVLAIQSRCYDAAKLESAQSFLAKLRASPTSCFMAWIEERPAGYLVAMPAALESPPALHGESYAIPLAAESLYLHDLAVHPLARGKKVAQALIAAFFEARQQSGLRFASLTAVNASKAFWERHGFVAVSPATALIEHLSGYGDGACYMHQDLGG